MQRERRSTNKELPDLEDWANRNEKSMKCKVRQKFLMQVGSLLVGK